MLLELITNERAEILEHAWRLLSSQNPERHRDEVMSDMDAFVDELIEAFARDRGVAPVRTSPFDPDASAAQHGLQRKRAGFEPWRLVQDYGAVCDAVTSLASERGVAVAVEEFGLLNRAVDAAAARAIDSYWSEQERERLASSAERVGTLAHELRNALHGAVVGFAILRQQQVGVQSRTGDAIERALRRMEGLIQRALAEAHEQAGAGLRCERVTAAALIDAVVGVAVPERGVRIDAVGDPAACVNADLLLIESALGNLVQNAIKFTAPGSVVQVRGYREGPEVRFDVEDRCGGLPTDADTEALFCPFVQSGVDRRGVGLGLAVARRAVEAHHGRIEVRDLPGTGCVFSIALPAAGMEG